MANMVPGSSGGPLQGDRSQGLFDTQLTMRYRIDGVFSAAAWIAVTLLLLVLVVLIGDVLLDGASRLSWQFLT